MRRARNRTLVRRVCLGLTVILLLGLAILNIACGNETGGSSGGTGTGAAAGLTEQSSTAGEARIAPAGTTNSQPSPPSPARDVVAELLGAFSLDSELAHLYTLASDEYQGRRFGSAGGQAAAAYIESEFSRIGLEPWAALGLNGYRQQFSANGANGTNLIGQLPGSDAAGPYLILAAHYDHLGLDASGRAFNGADDNAAGVAAVLEAARIFAVLGVSPPRTMIFCAFDGEEEGELGAIALGNLLVDSGLAPEVEMINIDGIGAIGGNYFGVWDEGSEAAAPLVAALAAAGERLGATVQNDGTDIGSDAQPFDWRFGIPAVTVDWDWGYDPSRYHPYYHTIDDDPDYINREVLEMASKVALTGFWIRASQRQ